MGVDQTSWVLKYWIEVQFGLFCAGSTYAFRKLSKKIQQRTKEDTAMKEANLALLDDSMGRLFRYCKDRGYATREEARRYERMYNAYTSLGGNGYVTNEHDQFQMLEIRGDLIS